MNQSLSDGAPGGGRWFRFAYLNRGRDGREILPYQARDGDATLAVHEALLARGYTYAGPLYNYPGRGGRSTTERQIQTSFLNSNDLLVLTTRPPLDDDKEPGRSNIACSYTDLESRVFASIRRHLSYCSRRRVAVSLSHVLASPHIARLGNIQFRLNGGAGIDAIQGYDDDRWRRQSKDLPDRVAYLVFETQAWPGGPGLLASFGISGTDTLAWNFILAKQYAHLIGAVPFAMVEIKSPRSPKQPQTLEFLRDWKVKVHTSPGRQAS